jgi:hypothetical protein
VGPRRRRRCTGGAARPLFLHAFSNGIGFLSPDGARSGRPALSISPAANKEILMLRLLWAGVCLLGILGGTSLVLAAPPRPALKGTASWQKSPLASKQAMGGLPSGSKLSPATKSAIPLSQLKLKEVKIDTGWPKGIYQDNGPPSCPSSGGPTTPPAPPTPIDIGADNTLKSFQVIGWQAPGQDGIVSAQKLKSSGQALIGPSR